MTQPVPAPTQTRHPWRAVARTLVAVAVAVVALLPLLPDIAKAGGIDQVPAVAAVLAVAGAVTRILALPPVDRWLRRWVPFLASEPAVDNLTPRTGGPLRIERQTVDPDEPYRPRPL